VLTRGFTVLLIVAFVVLVVAGSYLLWDALQSLRSPGGAVSDSDRPAAEIAGTGTFLVGSEVSAGTYRSRDAESGCNWSLYAGGIAVEKGQGGGDATVTVMEHYTLFRTSRCGAWVHVGD